MGELGGEKREGLESGIRVGGEGRRSGWWEGGLKVAESRFGGGGMDVSW